MSAPRTITKGNSTEFIDEHPNLLDYPPVSAYSLDKNCQLTIGDLHGNALKLLYFLVRESIFEITPEAYQDLVAIYYKDLSEITRNDLDEWCRLLRGVSAKETSSNRLIRLIGDELADRGANDYFVLKLLEKLGNSAIPYEIIISNHGFEFLSVYEQGLETYYSYLEKPPGEFAVSLSHLRALVAKKIVSMGDIDYLVKTYYQPYLKVLGYSCFAESSLERLLGITIYSHAPIGFETIRALARDMRVEYRDETAVLLAETMDRINHAFAIVAMNNALLQTYGDELKKQVDVYDIPMEYPLLRCLWARNYSLKDPPKNLQNNYLLFYVHGHDQGGKVDAHFQSFVTNLDNNFGKGQGTEKEAYSILISKTGVF